MSVYNSFTDRVNYAARCIRERRDTSSNRQFDACFEMNDGDAVAVAIYHRYQKRPDLYPIYDYLCRYSLETAIAKAEGASAQ